ncbi:hypothetical protein F5Y05DRAFT_412991 [Hypoxylon sp. FL0543]|nr:hypothetical protein F5Y05DRAFT_412991 [Hypoxylon sp. FL0543]
MPRKSATQGPWKPNQKYMDHGMARISSADPSPNAPKLNSNTGNSKAEDSNHHTYSAARKSNKRTKTTRPFYVSALNQSIYDREDPPIEDEDTENDDDDESTVNHYVQDSASGRTGHSAQQKNDLSKLLDAANDPKYAHLFSHLRCPGVTSGSGEATTTRPAKDQPVLRRRVNYFVIDDSDSDSDCRPRKRFGKQFIPEDSDEDGAHNDDYEETPKKFKKARLI